MKRRSFLQQAGLTVVASGLGLDSASAESAELAAAANNQNSPSRILVTSAHTALAVAIADALAARFEVRLTAPRKVVSRHSVIAGDLRDAGIANTLVEGVDAIVHVAEPPAEASADGRLDYRTRGTYNLLRSALSQGARHVIYLSSLTMLTAYDEDFEVTEDWRPIPTDDPEVLSHYLGEFTCREFAREGSIGVVVLRLGEIVQANDVADGAFNRLWIDQRDAVQAVAKALDACLTGADLVGHPWSVFHISSRSPQARFGCERSKRAFGYAPQFP